jgi:phosphinothricin acetyltransferase
MGPAHVGPRPRARLASPADGTACAAIYAPYVAGTAISFELVPPDGAEMAARIARTVERTPWVVVELAGTVRAYAYGTRHRERAAYDWTVETTVYVDPAFTRRGLGRTAMDALLAILRLQGAHLAVAGITAPNPGSVGLHLALGFERVGEFEAIGWKQGGWHGVEWFALELGPRTGDPSPLVPLPRLAGTPALEAALARATATGGG